jgi:cathepsin L
MMVKGEAEYDLSEEYVLECTTAYTKNVLNKDYSSTCSGGYVDFAGDLIRRNGAPLETTYPYLGLNYGSSSTTPTTTDICSATPTYIYAGDHSLTSYSVYRNLTNSQMKTLIS